MRTIDKLKQYKHKETYLEIVEENTKTTILIKYKENSELQLKMEVNTEDEKTIEMICGVLKFYEFSEHRNINSMQELKSFISKHNYYIGFKDDRCIFCANFMNGAIKKYDKIEIENMHKVNINAI